MQFFSRNLNFATFYVENPSHFNSADFIVAYQITAVTLMVMGNSKSLRVFNFAILLKSRKVDARKIYILQYVSIDEMS